MQTVNMPNDINKAILAARDAQRMTMRQFAEALQVSQNAVYQWEHGIAEPTNERLADWLKDQRSWVHQLGVKLFALKYGDMLTNAAIEPPKAA